MGAYIENLNRVLIKEGNLDGMLITGLTNEGLNLLQSHVDKTGDIQTVSLFSLHTSTQEINKDVRMQQWVNSYRSLLDSWRLWTQRAKFDVEFYKGHSSRSEKLPQQVLILSILHSPYSLHLIDLIKRSIFVLYIILFVAIKVKVKEIL